MQGMLKVREQGNGSLVVDKKELEALVTNYARVIANQIRSAGVDVSCGERRREVVRRFLVESEVLHDDALVQSVCHELDHSVL